MLVKVSMNDVVLRLKRAWKKEIFFIFIKLDMLSLNDYRNDYRLTMNYQGVSRVAFQNNRPKWGRGTIVHVYYVCTMYNVHCNNTHTNKRITFLFS